MKAFRISALLSIISTYILIFIGGLVRVAGAGLGCPDWPKCFGRWIPPLSMGQLPADIDPATFNITLAWIEYANRLVGVLIGLFIVVTAIMALRHFRKQPAVFWPSLISAVLVAFQGWLGGVVVATELHPVIVSSHLVLAIVIVLLLAYALLGSLRYSSVAKTITVGGSAQGTRWVGLLGLATITQIILGTQLRGHIEVIAQQQPLLTDLEQLAEAAVWQNVHMFVGVLVGLFAIVVAAFVIRTAPRESRLVRHLASTLILMVALQSALGFGFLFAGLEPLVQLFHLWLPTVMMGVILVLLAAVSGFGLAEEYQRRSLVKPLMIGVVIAVLMAIGAGAVVAEAEGSRESPVLLEEIQR